MDTTSHVQTSSSADGNRVELHHDADHHLGTTVACAIAELTETPVENLDVELTAHVDPDALDRLFAARLDGSEREGGRVVFPVDDVLVEVTADGNVVASRES